MKWTTPFTALLTVPATMALLIGLLAPILQVIELEFGTFEVLEPITAVAARQIFSVLASSAMTALTLAYSLTLVVFTLAASSIGPRLLKRFTTERVNQVTAGLLGGTFLFAIFSLIFADATPPRMNAILALFLAFASVVQLIWFVRAVAQSVSVDDEIAEITHRLRAEMDRLGDSSKRSASLPPPTAFWVAAKASRAGFVSSFDRDALRDLAVEQDVTFRTECVPGDYVFAGTPILSVCGALDDAGKDKLAELVMLEPSRSDTETVHFSINLLVEIALRALSPGLNDTFTALAVADLLSGALYTEADDDRGPEVLRDKSGIPRAILPGAEVTSLLDQAYHPLRRAAINNALMSQGLARAFARLYNSGGKDVRATIANIAGMMIDDLNNSVMVTADVDSVTRLLPPALLAEAMGDRDLENT